MKAFSPGLIGVFGLLLTPFTAAPLAAQQDEEPYNYSWRQSGTGAGNFATASNWDITGGPVAGPGPTSNIIDPAVTTPEGSIAPAGFGVPGTHSVNNWTFTRPDGWNIYAANSTTSFPTVVNVLGVMLKDGTGRLTFRGNPSTSFLHNIKSLSMALNEIELRNGHLQFGVYEPQTKANGDGSSHGALYGFTAQRISIYSGTTEQPTDSRLDFHVLQLDSYVLTTSTTTSYAVTSPTKALVEQLHFHGENLANINVLDTTTLSIGGLQGDSGTLRIAGNFEVQPGATLGFRLGAGGAHATLQRLGGNWTFNAAQQISLSGAEAEPGTYTGLITGLAADPGVASWTLAGEGWVGSFSYVAGAVNLVLTEVPALVPDAPVANSALLVNDISFLANWNAAADALSYELDVSTAANFATFLTGYEARNVGNRLDWSVTGLAAETTYYYRVRARNNAGPSAAYSNTISVTTTESNTPPTITVIANQTITVNGATDAIAFTVGDADTPAADLLVTGTSSNPALVPNTSAAIAFGGEGAARTVTITPAAGQTGVATITISVFDGGRTTTTSFTVTVNASPWPEFTSGNSTTFTIGLGNRFQVTAVGTPSPTFSATGLPQWATLNATTGVLSGTPPAGTAAGSVAIVITASNGVPPDATQNFTLTLQPIPAITFPVTITTLAGTPGSAGSTNATGAAARFNFPLGVAVDGEGNAYVADEQNHVIRRVTPAGVVTTIAGQAGTSGNTDGIGAAARFNSPSAVVIDGTGNLFVADTLNHTVRRITPAGEVTTIAGQAGTSGTADGTGAAARFNAPQALALNAAGTVLSIADTANHTVRRLTLASGAVTTFAGSAGQAGSVNGTGAAARFNAPTGLVLDAQGRVFVADAGNNTIRAISTAGAVTTLAGVAGSVGAADGVGTAARFNEPSSLSLDAAGTHLYVLDSENHTLRRIVIASGTVTTLAGLAGTPGSADGSASAARFNFPSGLGVAATGEILIADTANHTLRVGRLPLVPTIQTQPQSQTAILGNSVSFTVVASGLPAPTYQWRFNGVNIDGASAATYTIPSAQITHTGVYSVVVANAMGSVTSANVALSVNAPAPPEATHEGNVSGAGGGAPSLWFLGLLATVALLRRTLRRQPHC